MEKEKNTPNPEENTTEPEKNTAQSPKKGITKGVAAAFGVMGTAIVVLSAALIITNLPEEEIPSAEATTTAVALIETTAATDISDTVTEIITETVADTLTSASTSSVVEPTSTQALTTSSTAAQPSVSAESTTAEVQAQTTATTTESVQTTASQATTAVTTKAEAPKKGTLIEYSVDNSWANGSELMYGVQFGISNNSGSSISGWELTMEIDGLSSCQGWNGTYMVSGNTLKITNAEYNGDIGNGGTVVVGCNLGTTTDFKVKSAKLNGQKCDVKAGHVDQNAQNNQNNQNNQQNNNQNNGGSADVSALLKRTENAVQGDDWLYTDGNRIVDKDGKRVWLTGVNWFGYNTGTNTFDGLWNSQLKPSVEAIADHGFNLIRVPISAELINQWAAGEYPKANYNNAYNTELNDMNSLEIFDYFLKLAEENGIKVMPDIHSAETNASGHNVNLWYTSKVTVNDYYSALEWMAERYKNNDTIIAFDLKNEPHGKPYEGDGAAIWNDSKDANNWKYVAETAAAKILAKNPNVLILVEGTEIYPMDLASNSDYHSTNDKEYYFNWWGGNLRGVKDYPIDLGKYQNKLVYSPHDYGPTVYKQPWFEGNYTFDSLMKDCWRDNWFYIHETNTAPLLIGEWGGFMREPNLTWMTYMRQLIKQNKLNHTFWCFNANSGDTGGLVLDDFKTWDEEKYAFVKEVLWQEDGKFVGLDHAIPLGDNGITLAASKGLQ